MENVQLWLQPLILLTAFIFFWREAKASRRELKEDIREELNKIDVRFNRFENNIWERFGKVDARFDRLVDHIREDAGKVDARFGKVDARFDRIERILLEHEK